LRNDTGSDALSQSCIEFEHVDPPAYDSFEDFTSTIEQQIKRFEPDVCTELEKGKDPAAVKAWLESTVGPTGLMPYRASNQGVLLRIVGKSWHPTSV
jgi:hypothetical protein